MLKKLLCLLATLSVGSVLADTTPAKPTRPNVIVILTDDLGYNDLGCYGAKPEHIKTPNIDRFAAEGIRFTDGHAASAVCTPSRYSMLTGEFAYRSKSGGNSILPGDAPLTIAPGSFTLPALFKQQGYATGFVGKWHLGLGTPNAQDRKVADVDWNGDIKPGPNEIGFDESFFLPATGDRVPTVFVRDNHVVNLDPKDPITVSYKGPIGDEANARNHPELASILKARPECGHMDAITEGVSRIGFMTGGKAALWKDNEMAQTLSGEASKFVEKHKDQPFFLYYATHGIHEPRVPAARFIGKSGAGTYGDHVEELDSVVGDLMTTLKRLKLDENTLIVFSSDNGGCSRIYYDYPDLDFHGHKVNGTLRGEKGSIWEGGTRIPFMVRWPGHVTSGKVSPALVSQTDLLASFAQLLKVKLPDSAAPDSINVLEALVGKSEVGRKELVEHAYGPGKNSALRIGNWKWIKGELYDLSSDLAEKHDLSKENPDRAKDMEQEWKKLLELPKTR